MNSRIILSEWVGQEKSEDKCGNCFMQELIIVLGNVGLKIFMNDN